MAQAGSAYNTHNRHQENHVKIGNWVEERALIETAPKMCVPEWGDVNPETGAKVRWSNKMTKVRPPPPPPPPPAVLRRSPPLALALPAARRIRLRV